MAREVARAGAASEPVSQADKGSVAGSFPVSQLVAEQGADPSLAGLERVGGWLRFANVVVLLECDVVGFERYGRQGVSYATCSE